MSPRPRLTEVRRRQILEAAAAVIAERGIAEARVSDIAERIGVSPGLILYYFESKDGLLGEALAAKDREFFDAVTAAMSGESSPSDRLVTLIEASCPSADGKVVVDEEYVLWIEIWSRARHDDTLAKSRRDMDVRWRSMISALVSEGQAEGEFDRTVDPHDFALRLSALIDGLAIQVMLGDDDVGPEVMRRLCMEAAGRELGGGIASVGGVAPG